MTILKFCNQCGDLDCCHPNCPDHKNYLDGYFWNDDPESAVNPDLLTDKPSNDPFV